MEFYTVSDRKRPVRLSPATRQFAFDSLHARYGKEAMETPAVSLDHIDGFDQLSPLAKERTAIREICRHAPLRICDGELLSGAATLGAAIDARIPATYGGEYLFYGINHLTVDFETVLKKGIRTIREEIALSETRHSEPREREFLHNCRDILDSMELFRDRYRAALHENGDYLANEQALLRVPFEPASDFREAVQSLWFTFAFLRLCGNWPGIGRLDVLLGDYLKRDLASGRITLYEAREILAHFFIKGCEWIRGGNQISGDAQHYQNIVLAGVGEDGQEVTNEVTYLVLDILEELPIGDFPTTIRLNRNSDERLIRRVAEVLRYGGGVLAVYNEEIVLDALTGYGYPLSQARRFANDGCWEVQIPGETDFSYIPFDSLAILEKTTLKGYDPSVSFDSFDDLFRAYMQDLHRMAEGICRSFLPFFRVCDPVAGRFEWVEAQPCTAVSLFERGCIASARSYLEGGPVYRIRSPHIGGAADTADSLYVIKKLVFDERKLSFRDFMEVLRANWEGHEPLRQYVRHHYRLYGNDNPEVDGIFADILNGFSGFCRESDTLCGYRFPSGVSTFGRQLEWAPIRLASAHGYRKGDILAANASPTPGSDREGATAVIRSYGRADLTRQVTGAALDIRLLPSSVAGEEGLQALMALLRGFITEKGFFVQFDVADAAVLREAQKHPEQFETLSVRVSGWNARFVTLCREWQDMVIQQNET